MREILSSIITNVLSVLYQQFWFSLLLAILFMFFYLHAHEKQDSGKGWKKSLEAWFRCFKQSSEFRTLFFLVFYFGMILFRTLVNRSLWLNPLSDVLGGWWIYKINASTGEIIFTTECIENVVLFIPFIFLLAVYKKVKDRKRVAFMFCIKLAFLISIAIEFLQLFLRVGTFQVADIFYNTLGGGIGWCVYALVIEFSKNKTTNQ